MPFEYINIYIIYILFLPSLLFIDAAMMCDQLASMATRAIV
jgi:hypothetical protein